MSDTPPPQTEVTEDDQPSGGWKQPASASAWRAPEKTVEQQGWRVPTLPANLKEQPAQTGDWHLPSPEDTIFTPQDVIEITPLEVEVSASTVIGDAIAPEDALFGAAQAASSASVVAQVDAPVAPEDLMYMLEHIDEKDDDFDTLHMSELVALANLADSQPMDALPGADSPISAAQATANAVEDSGLQNAVLSPAERLALKPAVDDPGEYARQQLALLGGTAATPVVADVTGAGSGTAEIDPGEYARQQLAQLGVGTATFDPGISVAAAPAPAVSVELLNPREQELARRYHDTQEKVQSLRRMMQAGQISPDDFQAQLRDLMILDDDQQWWMMGVETDTWYKSDGSDWAQSTPPVLVKEDRIKRVSARDLSGIVQQPLDYLPDSQPQAAASAYQEFSSPASEIRLDENFMPLPNQVPVNDPDFTVPNPNVIDINTMRLSDAPTLPGSSFTQDTVPSAAFSDQTVMATPVSYGTVEAPYDVGIDEPPDYDVEQIAPVYEEAAERQRQSTFRTLAFIAAGLTVLVFLAAGAFIAFALLWYQGIVDSWEPQIAAVANYEPPFQTIEILDSTGAEIATLGREGADRRDVTLDRISPYFIHAVISLENERFYEDPG
ncbi:MAG: transglycosylase domain-containing protein, partial [Chitinophagaceae bacterium]|nr:transglycosylase domain-containing protein [Anaerolineae bacterium]